MRLSGLRSRLGAHVGEAFAAFDSGDAEIGTKIQVFGKPSLGHRDFKRSAARDGGTPCATAAAILPTSCRGFVHEIQHAIEIFRIDIR